MTEKLLHTVEDLYKDTTEIQVGNKLTENIQCVGRTRQVKLTQSSCV